MVFSPSSCPITTILIQYPVGWIATTRALADIFSLQGLYTLHFVMTVLMCGTWLVLIILTVMAFWKGLIFKSAPEDVIKDKMPLPPKEMDVEKGPDAHSH